MALTLLDRARALIGRDRAENIDFRRMLKFGIVGLSGTFIDLAIFWLLYHVLHIRYLLAGVMSPEIAIWSNYLLNNNWTFVDRRTAFISFSGVWRYHLVSLGGIGINVAILGVLAGPFRVQPLLGKLGGISVAMIWNYVLNVCWTWRRRRTRVVESTLYAQG